MKKTLLFLTLALMLVALAAQEDVNPLRQYLDKPGLETFSKAMEYLTQLQIKAPENRQIEMQAAYFASMEINRILRETKEILAELSAGEQFLLGNILMSLDRLPEAVEIYDRINRDYPNWSCPWRHKGEALYKQKDYKAAVKALEQSIETNKEHYDAYVWAAFALYELKKYKQARKYLEIAFSLQAGEEGHYDEAIADVKIQELYEKLKQKTK
ncbi:MAG: tetratricopeptide repeat protein [Candidatus Cloacimonetes bacterium]|nr:tetratricopeptide repeat protein [Candidatus Cloacimonadota bacterium]